jgi:AI-2 transport protein TqsA
MAEEVKVPSNFYPIVKWASIFIIIGAIKMATPIVLPLLIALFISMTLSHPIAWLEQKNVPHTLAVIIALLVFGGFGFLIGEILGQSISMFVKNYPVFREQLEDKLMGDTFLSDLGIDMNAKFTDDETGKIMEFLIAALNGVRNVFGQFLFISILTLFLVFEINSFPTKFKAIFIQNTKSTHNKNLDAVSSSIRRYLGIKTLTSFTTGLLIFIVLYILGVKYALMWGLLAFLLNFVPQIGSLIAAIPAIVFAWVQLGSTGFWGAGITFAVVNVLIGSILEPRIMGQGMGLSTFVVFLSLIFWGWIMGPVGMFLSVPLTMVLKIFLETNESSKYFAILLGTKQEAEKIIKSHTSG